MNKVLVAALIINFTFILINSNTNTNMIKNQNQNQKFLLNNKEVVTINNLDDVYGSHAQQEMLVTSDYKCVFRCSSDVKDEAIEKKYKEVINDFSEKNMNLINIIDVKYFCTQVKPLYIVKLTPDVTTREEAQKTCTKKSKMYKLAEQFCKKDSECSSPTIEIRNDK